MKEINYNCNDINLLLTEYYRKQLDKVEIEYIREHIKICSSCLRELSKIKNLCNSTDKLIPYLKNDFDKKIIYSIFIKEKKEKLIIKILSIISILFIIFLSLKSNKYTIIPLNEMQIRVNDLFLNDSMIIKNNEDNK